MPSSVRATGTGAAVDWADSGLVALTGHHDGPPLVPPGRAATRARELGTALAEATGGRVRLDGARLLSERAGFTGHTRRGRVSAGGSCRLLRTADGWAAVSCARPDDPSLLGALVGAELPADPWPAVGAWLAAHTGAELAGRATLLGIAAAPVRHRTAAPPVGGAPARDVTGRLVVDFSALWAGPLCAHLLGLAGARVVKVETPWRPDGARLGDPGFYRLLHAGHRSVVLDPGTPAGRRALAALVDAADVVIEASRPRALARWGLDAAASASTGTTWISITAAGRGSDRVGFGDDVAAAAGLVARDAANQPVFCGDALADPLTGLTAAVLALTTPAGSLLDIAMADTVAATLDPGPAGKALAARRRGDQWTLDTPSGRVAVRPPRRRAAQGAAPPSGADTDEVLRGLGIPRP
ncbi:CoA transferase [Pseudonocardia eucalypti]|uniref:CoA transferase n=1 Tax=Pseudonocardia eucalypti TaxID=648755 RepID=A0ABP9PP45_9PSEU|nr:crotonobetainyl-CoA:carnitine CoA-transferase CaiB-like acyl-CoA transferase [Pseudonocardia eucalypti]